MKLIFQRYQDNKKGMMGGYKGVTFTVSCFARVSDQELALIEKYSKNHYVLLWNAGADGKIPALKLSELINGKSFKSDNVADVQNVENSIETEINNLKNYLTAAKGWNGETEMEIDL